MGCRSVIIDHFVSFSPSSLKKPSAMLSGSHGESQVAKNHESSLKELRVASSQQPVRRQEPRCYCHKERNSGNNVKETDLLPFMAPED